MPITNEPLGPVHTSVKTVRKVKDLGDQIPKYLIEDTDAVEATQKQYNDLKEVGDDFDPDSLVYKHAKAAFGGSNPPEAILVVRAVPQNTYVSPTSLTVDPSSISGVVGQTGKVTTTVLPSTATEKNVTATSGDTDVATVSPNGDGSFTIVYKSAGHATITFRVGVNDDIIATTKVTVTANLNPVTGVSLDKTSLSGTVGGNDQLKATITPANATDTNVSFSSKDEGIATVDNSGKVSYVKAGHTQITATTEDGGFTATCDVTVSGGK
ncbi:bacterial group 2 Ig-like protein [Lentilactobacillus parafarraginis F0439]|uniref:Bacterial group 2 Ig-like protein n=1 Tax=Lentilactobacillus parafarraginis F0439 TaxID=797515 RepID=G9ZRI1_9LACO|nr:Ig-like domain-containing protein [Lentilactobacillus parafarraginis]EHL96602.1 bacterial group 2 Ig-like protein [Lentilactobacillus parafarraginis F0439]